MKISQFGHYLDQLLETVINQTRPSGPHQSSISDLAREIRASTCQNTRVVIFGGGTGLSTVIGGNSRLDSWPEDPFVGLKQEFPLMDVVVCTTDDGGSTGLLLQQLPIIGIGDIRKVLLSLIKLENLQEAYGMDGYLTGQLIRVIHGIFNHRFPKGMRDFRYVVNPLLIVPKPMRRYCPEPLKDLFSSLGRYISTKGKGPVVIPGGHCLGNLMLAAAIFSSADEMGIYPPDTEVISNGIEILSRAIGVTPGFLHPATATPGQLILRYSNGVAVRGQSKSAVTRRLLPIDHLSIECCETPHISETLLKAIQKADLILFAPGSLYTSIMPILQLTPIAQAIRKNRKALKILGANFWVQAGETDVSRRRGNRGFYVSELVEAYDQNVAGGSGGLFDVVLSANLEHIPGDVIRNYALEGKSPIYLDRSRVEKLGILPLEATIYSMKQLGLAGVIHHDPQKFSLAIRALLIAHQRLNLKRAPVSPRPFPKNAGDRICPDSPLLYSYHAGAGALLEEKRFNPKNLKNIMHELVWENRDIRIEHLKFFSGAKIIPARKWTRSDEWDNVLGYYDPEDSLLKIHEKAGEDPEILRDNLLTALGESLLGRYIESRNWVNEQDGASWGMRRYEIRLRPADERACFLNDAALRWYLRLSRLLQSPRDPNTFGITINDQEGFLPPGLLFGLLYAWYLNNAYGAIMEYEMSILRWSPKNLIPYQLEEYTRKQALIKFFRNVVFLHDDE